MKLVANGVNKFSLKNIIDNLHQDNVTEVLVAVAYVDNSSELFNWCYKNNIKLTFFGRYDKSVPVVAAVLKTFIDRGSDKYRCHLIRDYFHPKVYWFKGYGVYIGSSNISERSWFKNIEAGLFLTEDEIVQNNLEPQLENFFDYLKDIDVSTILSKDIYEEIASQEKSYYKSYDAFDANNKDGVSLIPEFVPDVIYKKEEPQKRKKDAFLKEWNATLQVISEIADLVSKDENRPEWLPKDTPKGIQVDQFLHRFYYIRTKSDHGRKYLYEDFFNRNKNDIANNLQLEFEIWKNTPSGSNEEIFATEHAPIIKKYLSPSNILKLSKDEFVELCGLFHAFRNVARYFHAEELGFSKGQKLAIEQKIPLAAEKIFNSRAENGMSVLQILNYVFYGGASEHVVHRLFEAVYEEKFSIPRFGRSCYGELVGWALPDTCFPRNDRTNKALRGLGYNVHVWNPGIGEE